MILYIFLAAISGVFVILSMVTNSNLAKRVGVLQSTLVNYTMGLGAMLILALLFGQYSDLTAEKMSQIPIWAFGGGLVGALIVMSSNVVIPKIPVMYSTLLFFIGQIVAGLAIDFFSSGNLPTAKVLGGLIVLAGMAFNVALDFRESRKYKMSSEEDAPVTVSQ